MAQLGRQAGALRTDSAKGLEAYRDRLRAGAKALDEEVPPAGTYKGVVGASKISKIRWQNLQNFKTHFALDCSGRC